MSHQNHVYCPLVVAGLGTRLAVGDPIFGLGQNVEVREVCLLAFCTEARVRIDSGTTIVNCSIPFQQSLLGILEVSLF